MSDYTDIKVGKKLFDSKSLTLRVSNYFFARLLVSKYLIVTNIAIRLCNYQETLDISDLI